MKLLPDKPVLLLKNKVVIADLHLGLFKYIDDQIIKEVAEISKLGEELIILGDLKHIGRWCNIKKLLDVVDSVTLIKGNHDVNIKENINIESSKGIRIGKYGLFHGHALPSEDVMQAKKLIFAHAHPSIFLADDVGGVKKRVWLEGEMDINGERKEILVIPAFNEMCASTAVNVEKPAGVIFKRWDYKNANAILLDGTLLTLSSL